MSSLVPPHDGAREQTNKDAGYRMLYETKTAGDTFSHRQIFTAALIKFTIWLHLDVIDDFFLLICQNLDFY